MSPLRRCALIGCALFAATQTVWPQDARQAQEDHTARLRERELLPKAPSGEVKPWRPIDLLDDVPELCFEEMLSECTTKEMADKHTEAMLEKIRRLESQRPAGFVAAVKRHRADLAGLPFLMGKEVAMNPILSKNFVDASASLSQFTQPFSAFASVAGLPGSPVSASALSRSSVAIYETGRFSGVLKSDIRPTVKSNAEFLASALLAKQRLFALDAEGRLALTQLLQATPLSDVNSLLAEVALYAPEPEIRAVALQSLKVRRGDDYVDVFLEGLKYPLRSVANNAADAIIHLELEQLARTVAAFVDDLDGQTPREIDGRWEVREVVKINHSRNCILCHSPAAISKHEAARFIAFAAKIPNPQEPLPDASARPYYVSDDPAKSIRFDVTYLRPDFSLTLPTDATYSKWPERQRFDFLVRTRLLRTEEAAAFEAARPFLPRSANREAALRVLRDLTGEDVGSTSAAWFKLLNK